MHFAQGIGQVNAESEQWRIQPKITFLFINIFYSELHHSKIEIEALLFHPGSFFPRRLYKIEKSAQQKGLYFSDILPRSPGAGVSDLRSPLSCRSRANAPDVFHGGNLDTPVRFLLRGGKDPFPSVANRNVI